MTITPDTKSWTWVLDRACPQCGFDASRFQPEDVPSRLREVTLSWRAILADPPTLLRHRPEPTVWSPLEYGCHVRDTYRIFSERLRLMLAESDPLFANWDQDATAVAEAYDRQDPSRVQVELGGAAEVLASRFEGVAGRDWQRTSRRSDGASFTVESFARYFIHDPIHHLWDVTGKADG